MTLIFGMAMFALVLAVFVSIGVGAGDAGLGDVVPAIFSFNPANKSELVVRDIRLPRVIIGAIVGACFAMSGAVMQALTRNPLAEPGILGLNAGAALALVIVISAGVGNGLVLLTVVSLTGAAFGAVLVYGIVYFSAGGVSPARLALAGTTVALLLASITSGILLRNLSLASDVLFYTAGGVAGASWAQFDVLLPCFAVGSVGMLLIARQLTVFLLGDEVAAGLGQRTAAVRVFAALLVILLAGAAVAVAGPIAFIGLMIPHGVRAVIGVDYRMVLPLAAIAGALLFVVADIVARTVASPFEIPVGFIMVIIGVPFLLFLIRRDGRLA